MNSLAGPAIFIFFLAASGVAQSLEPLTVTGDTTTVAAPLITDKDSEAPVLWGHNLTPTTYILKKNQVTAGTYVVGVGLTDSLMICTSPWIDLLYNMPAINARYLVAQPGNFRLVFDASYLKTFPYLRNYYEQESTYLRLVASQKFSNFYTVHAAFDYQYFWDETVPYSLDPTPGYGYVTSLSALHEMHWFKHYGTFLEMGVLGLNYDTPYLHFGASVFGTWNNIMVQLGVSRSSSMGMEYAMSGGYGYWYLTRILWHPEVQLQAYF